MSVLWLVPQYLLFGISETFTLVGLEELFYSQVPNEIRSIGIALFLGVLGVGSFLSTFLISILDKTTCTTGSTTEQHSWFANHLNQAHLDYLYWLLALLSGMALVAYMFFATSYSCQ